MGLFSFTQEIAMDLGTANTIIITNGKIVVDEPSVVALDRRTDKMIAVGEKAKLMHEKTHENIRTIRPLRDGVIADFYACEQMMRGLIKQVNTRNHLFSPSLRMVIGVPSGSTEVELRAVRDSAEHAGGRDVYLIFEPMAAAIGAGLPVTEPTGSMVVDIGGGTTGISIFKDGKVVYIADEPTGGTHFSLVVSGAYKLPFDEAELYKRNEDNHKELLPVLKPVIEKVASIISRHIAKYDVDEISLVGGTCCLTGIEGIIQKSTGVYTHKPKNPMFVTPLGIALSCTDEPVD